MHTGFVDLGK